MLVGFSPYRTMQRTQRTGFKAANNSEIKLSPEADNLYKNIKSYKHANVDERIQSINDILEDNITPMFENKDNESPLNTLKEVANAATQEKHWISPWLNSVVALKELIKTDEGWDKHMIASGH